MVKAIDSEDQVLLSGLSQSQKLPMTGSMDADNVLAKRPTSVRPESASTSTNDDFDYIKQIGEGSYGSVYLARDLKTNDVVAIKQLNKLDLL